MNLGLRRNDSGRSQRRGKFIKCFESVILKGQGVGFGVQQELDLNSVSGILYPDLRQVTSQNFSVLFGKMGMTSFS